MIKIEYDDRPVLDALQDLQRRMDDMTPAMRDITGVMADAAERAFETESDPATGRQWDALTATTVALRGGDARPILNRSGGRGLVGSISTDYGDDYAVIGTNKVYAARKSK